MRLRILGLFLLGAAGLCPTARAEASGAPAADAQSPAPPLVIVADVADNATQNSQIRATLYEVARDHGYDAAGKLDVEGVAASESLMRAGAITTDPGELERLRNALKVAVLVRISKDADQGAELTAHITILTKEGMKQKAVSAARGAPQEALRSALDAMLPHIYNPKAAASKPNDVLPPTASGALLLTKPPPDKPFDSQQVWQDRGGFRGTYGARALISGLLIKNDPYDPDRPELGNGDTLGVGGGVGVEVGFIYLPIPDPTVATGSFAVFRGGVGLDTEFFYARHPKGYQNGTTVFGNQALWISSLPIVIGFGFAGGHFIDKTAWRGVIVGVAYAPAAQFRMNLKNAFGEGKSWLGFNPAGAEITVDISKLNVNENTDPSMQIRLMIWGLLPIDLDRPGQLTAGVGAIWY